MLFDLLLANTADLLCFLFLIHFDFNVVFAVPIVKENARLKLVLAIPTGVLITIANETI